MFYPDIINFTLIEFLRSEFYGGDIVELWKCKILKIGIDCIIKKFHNEVVGIEFLENSKIKLGNRKFLIKSFLGSGCYGLVLEILEKSTKKIFALKIFYVRKDGEKEYYYHSLFRNCINIVNIYESEIKSDYFIFLMDRMKCDLEQVNPDTKSIIKICENIIFGLKQIHEKKIIHLDIKLKNIYLDENGVAYIGDFSNCIFINETNSVYINPSIDIFNLGIILLELLNNNKSVDIKKNQIEINNLIEKILKNRNEKNSHGFLLRLLKDLLVIRNNILTSEDILIKHFLKI